MFVIVSEKVIEDVFGAFSQETKLQKTSPLTAGYKGTYGGKAE